MNDMLEIAIVEDDAPDAEKLQQYLTEYFTKKQERIHIQKFSNGEQFLFSYPHDARLIFLDIQLGRLNGIDIAHEIRKIDQNVALVFTTNLAQYVFDGYEVEALDFLVKPLTYPSFSTKMDRIYTKISRTQNHLIEVHTGKTPVYIRPEDISFCETSRKKMIIHQRNGAETLCSESKAELEEKLSPYPFFSCHRSFIVNLNFIDTMSSDTVTVSGTVIPISKYKKQEFLSVLTNYIGGHEI